MEKKKYSNNIVTRDVRICPMTGGSNIGAMISLSFKNAEYIRVEFLEDKITFVPVSEPVDDGCFYSKYVRDQARIFLPRIFLNYYRTVEGYELMGRTVPRLIVDGGYGIKVKRIREFTLTDLGLRFNTENLPHMKDFDLFGKNFTDLKRALHKSEKEFTIIDLYYGTKAAAFITPSNNVENIPTIDELRKLVGFHFQFFTGQHIRYVTTSKNPTIPRGWFQQFDDYKKKEFAVYSDGNKFFIQMHDECIVDGKTIHSAEFNSGELYICSDCQNVAKEQDEELLNLVKGLIESYDKMKAMYEAASKDVAMYKAKAEMLNEAIDTSGMSSISMKLHKMRMAEKEARIAELEAKNKALEPEVEFIDLNDII